MRRCVENNPDMGIKEDILRRAVILKQAQEAQQRTATVPIQLSAQPPGQTRRDIQAQPQVEAELAAQRNRESMGQTSIGEALIQGRPMEFLRERVRLLLESPAFRQRIAESTRRNVGTATAVGGAMLAGPFAAATGTPLAGAEAVTAMAGEAARQGITGEGGPVDMIIAGGLPPALRGVFRSGRAALRQAKRLPGAAAGLIEEAVEQGQRLIQHLRPQELQSLRVSVQALDNLQVPLQRFRGMAQSLADDAQRLAPALRPQSALRIVQQVDDLIAAADTEALPLRQVRDNLEEIGAEIGRLRRAVSDRSGLVRGASRNLNALRRTYATLLKSFDDLPGNTPQSLRDYRQALRTDFATTDLERIIENGVQQRAADGLTFVQTRRIANAWRRAKGSDFLRESFTAAQRAQIDEYMDELLRLPPLPRPPGVAAGSAMVLTRGGGVGGIVGGLTGSPEAGMLAGGAAILAPRIIARAMMTPEGRRSLRAILSEQRFITPQTIQFLAATTRQPIFPAQPVGEPAVESMVP